MVLNSPVHCDPGKAQGYISHISMACAGWWEAGYALLHQGMSFGMGQQSPAPGRALAEVGSQTEALVAGCPLPRLGAPPRLLLAEMPKGAAAPESKQ